MRLPAAFCGVYGLKPSYGMLSRWGVVSYADSLDTVGILARNVADVQTVYDVLAQPDAHDSTCVEAKVRATLRENVAQRIASLDVPLQGLRIGIVAEAFPAEMEHQHAQAADDVLEALRTLGATLVPLRAPTRTQAPSAYYVLALAEASSNLGRFDGIRYGAHPSAETGASFYADIAANRTYGFGEEVAKRILLGTYALTAEARQRHLHAALRIREALAQETRRIFALPDLRVASYEVDPQGVDMLVYPTSLAPAPRLDEATSHEYAQDTLTVEANLTGLPAFSVPVQHRVHKDNVALPIGLTFQTQWGYDALLFYVVQQLQQHTNAWLD